MKVTCMKAKKKVMELSFGETENNILASGTMIRRKDMAFIKCPMGTLSILGNGKGDTITDRGHISKMGFSMLLILRMVNFFRNDWFFH